MLDWKTLLSEDGVGFSLGRVAFWIALAFSTHFWFVSGVPFPPALLEFLGSTLLYNLGAKGVNAYTMVRTGTSTTYASTPMGGQQINVMKIATAPKPAQDVSTEDLETTKPTMLNG